MKTCLIAALILLLTACAGTTARIEPAKLNEVQKGVTTVAEVTRQFGRPSVLSKNPDGTQTAVYIYNDAQTTGTAMVTLLVNEPRDSVTFNFDTKGLLTDVKTTEANRKPAAAEPAKTSPTASAQPAAANSPAPTATSSAQPATAAPSAAKPAPGNTNSNKWSLPSWLPSPSIENR
jgi:outer membrane protein assembly factor BamE (lipoprotein component of BamABCDE complex)